MKQHNSNLLMISALTIMTIGLSLLGFQQGSAGAVARHIECNSKTARNIQVAESLKQLSGMPPCRLHHRSGPFSFS